MLDFTDHLATPAFIRWVGIGKLADGVTRIVAHFRLRSHRCFGAVMMVNKMNAI
jgi:hypothetical protein